jgi:hypothetical protein
MTVPVYLRLLDVPVPVIYGRSADENPLPKVDLVEEGEPLIQDLMRSGNLALDIHVRSSRGQKSTASLSGFKTMRVRPSPARCATAQNHPALSNARFIHAIRVASTSATALSLTL